MVDTEADRLSLVHQATGQVLRSAREEEARAEQAERRAEEADARARARATHTLILILETRGWTVDGEARRRILGCRDDDQLDRWTREAFTAPSLDDLLSR